jgi:hypothetical protein
MKAKRTALALTIGTALGVAKPTTGHAQSATAINPVPVPTPATAEQKVLPNPPLLGAGLASLAIGYVPALGVAIGSDHKGDNQLFIPVVGPWLDIVCGARCRRRGSRALLIGDGGRQAAALFHEGVPPGLRFSYAIRVAAMTSSRILSPTPGSWGSS